MDEFKYVGAELELFAEVHNWKSYWSRQIHPFISGNVLEVGAGIAANTRFLDAGGNGRWVCLEPDPQLANQLTANLVKARSPAKYEAVCGTAGSLDGSLRFDTIIYIDVLEHIEKDREELERAASLLHSGGRIIVLSPAHQWLFTPFDAAIGHFRRYNRVMVRNITPRCLRLERVFYLDCAGLALSMTNRVLLRQSMPTRKQLYIWDHWVIPVSRILDKCLFYGVGKSIVAIWRLAEQPGY